MSAQKERCPGGRSVRVASTRAASFKRDFRWTHSSLDSPAFALALALPSHQLRRDEGKGERGGTITSFAPEPEWRSSLRIACGGRFGSRHDPGLIQFGDEFLDSGLLDHSHFPCGKRLPGWHSLSNVNVIERGNLAASARRQSCLGFGSLGSPALAFLAGGANSQAGQFAFGGLRQGVAIRLLVFEHVPGDRDQFASRSHDRDVPVFLLLEFTEERAQRSRMAAYALCGLNQEPSSLARTGLGNGAVVALTGRLPDARDQSQIARGLVRFGKSRDVGKRGLQRMGRGVIQAWQSHEQPNVGIVIRLPDDQIVDHLGLPGERLQQHQIDIDQASVERIEGQIPKPVEPRFRERSADGNCNHPPRQDGMNPVPDGGPLSDQGCPSRGKGTTVFDGRCGRPDPRQVIAPQQMSQNLGVNLVGLDVGLGDRPGLHRIGDNDFGDMISNEADERPGVAGDFDRQAVSGSKLLAGELLDLLGGDIEPALFERGSVLGHNVVRGGLLVQIDAHEPGLRRLAAGRCRVRSRSTAIFPSCRDLAHRYTPEAFPRGLVSLCLEHVQETGGPNRQLPLRARSSTGLVVRALRYDGGLMAHRHNRAAPGRSAPVGTPCSKREETRSDEIVHPRSSAIHDRQGLAFVQIESERGGRQGWKPRRTVGSFRRTSSSHWLKPSREKLRANGWETTGTALGNHLAPPRSEEHTRYDALNRRIAEQVDADGAGAGSPVTTWTVFDGQNPYVDFDGSGSLAQRYLHGAAVDALLARSDASGVTDWYLTDRLGSVRDIVDTSGTVLYHTGYDSFGNKVSTTGSGGDRFGFTGREYDAALNLYYYRARFYDPSTGRFVSKDPLGYDAGDANLYRYVGNGPTNGTDPSGFFEIEFIRVRGTDAWTDEQIKAVNDQIAKFSRMIALNIEQMKSLQASMSPDHAEAIDKPLKELIAILSKIDANIKSDRKLYVTHSSDRNIDSDSGLYRSTWLGNTIWLNDFRDWQSNPWVLFHELSHDAGTVDYYYNYKLIGYLTRTEIPGWDPYGALNVQSLGSQSFEKSEIWHHLQNYANTQVRLNSQDNHWWAGEPGR